MTCAAGTPPPSCGLTPAARTRPRSPQAAEALGPATRARQVLTLIASSSSVWAWLAAAADTAAAALAAATAAHPAVRVAVGPVGAGIDGFRRSHFDAVATQRLMSRRPDLRVARFADVQLVTLALQDEQRAREFVARTLGKLADADRELRDTLCVYIGEQFSAARAARALYTHRNTVLNRLQRAERLLRSRWPATAWTSASRSRSPSGWARNRQRPS